MVGLQAFMLQGARGLDQECEWHCRLSVPTRLVLRDRSEISILALVDTGSEVNIIRRGLIDPSHTSACGPEIHFFAVNKQSLGRNHQRLSCDIILSGFDQDTGARVELRCLFRACNAPIDVDIILSYE